jgi:uncharacterized protein
VSARALTVPIAAALLGAALVIGCSSIGNGIRDRNGNDTISVTGSAKKRITSDYAIWDASISSQRRTARAAALQLGGFTKQVESFLRAQGVLGTELTVGPVTAQAVEKGSDYNGNGTVIGYLLTRSFEVRSSRVTRIAAVVEHSSALLEDGIPIEAQPLQYIFTRLASVRPALLAAATRDALRRARVLVGATGARLGNLREVDVGVFQVTSPNSTDVSDYGEYDTSTLQKDVTAVVNVTFALG